MQKAIGVVKYYFYANILITFLLSNNSEILRKTFSNFSNINLESSHSFFVSVNSDSNLYYGSVIKISDNLNLQGSIMPDVKNSFSFYYNFGVSYKLIQDILNKTFLKTEVLINMLKFDTIDDIKWFHSTIKWVYEINNYNSISSSINYSRYKEKPFRFLNIGWDFSINSLVSINLETRIFKNAPPTRNLNLNIKL